MEPLVFQKKNTPDTIKPPPRARTSDAWQTGSMCSWCFCQNVTLQSKSSRNGDLSRPGNVFLSFLSSSFIEPMWNVASVSCTQLTVAVTRVVFWCCRTSAWRFNVLCIQRWYSAHLVWHEYLFKLIFPFFHPEPVWPLPSEDDAQTTIAL